MTPLPDEAALSDLDDAEAELAERLDGAHYRDDVLRLLFICCHPDLPATQQIALALRIVSGLSLAEIARAFLVSESAMEQRITRAKARIAKAEVPFDSPGPVERAERLAAVSAMIYLVFNSGYSAGTGSERAHFSGEAIRLARLLLRLFQTEPELMGLTALMLLQHARSAARFDTAGDIVLLDDQDPRALGQQADRRRPRAHRQGDAPPPAWPLSNPGGHRRVARESVATGGDRLGRDRGALRGARTIRPIADRDPEPRGRGRQAPGTRCGAGDDRNRSGRGCRATSTFSVPRAPC